jgi:hypothetical protein
MLEESVSNHGHERVAVEALPGSPLEVVETHFFFQLLVSLLANPSRLEGGDCDRALPTIRLGYVNAPGRYRSRPRKSTVRGRTLAVWAAAGWRPAWRIGFFTLSFERLAPEPHSNGLGKRVVQR